MIRVSFCAVALAAFTVLLPAAPTFAQTPSKKPAPAAAAPTQSKPAALAPESAASGTAREIVGGFRSAKFGMNEADVRSAIARDFAVKPDAIRSEENPTEQTHVLTVSVPDLLQGGGKADVSYVFGFKTKTLIQVGVVWSKATDDKLDPDRLFSNANILRSHFMAAGYRPETVATNAPVNNGLLMFRGSDAKDRTTMLLLQGTTENRDNQRVLTPTSLLLFYVADAKSPDVFRLPAGQF